MKRDYNPTQKKTFRNILTAIDTLPILCGSVSLVFFFILNSLHGQSFLAGADLSYVNSVVANGGVYRDANGNPVEPFSFFKERGAGMVRLRLWHTPENNIDKCGDPISANNLNDVVSAFRKAKAQGMKLNLAIHYGDYFNDPSCQIRPEAWNGLTHQILLDSIYKYTFDVMLKLKENDIIPDIVAIGNETTWGFIDASATTDGWSWPEDADKFNIGLKAIDDFNDAYQLSVKKALHFTDNTAAWLTQLFVDQGISNFDIIGLSFYPMWSEFDALQDLGDLVMQLKTTFNKEVMIFETGAPWTIENADTYSNFMNDYGLFDYAISPQGQKDYLLDLAYMVYKNGGTGVLYWEPAWISSEMCDRWGKGSSYENVSFFDFNHAALPAFDFFNFSNSLQSVKVNEGEGISIFPNPTHDGFVLSGVNKPAEIKLADCLGRTVKIVKNSNSRIDISDLRQGVYFIFIRFEHTLVIKRIIKE